MYDWLLFFKLGQNFVTLTGFHSVQSVRVGATQHVPAATMGAFLPSNRILFLPVAH
jgi:hypothetical protein